MRVLVFDLRGKFAKVDGRKNRRVLLRDDLGNLSELKGKGLNKKLIKKIKKQDINKLVIKVQRKERKTVFGKSIKSVLKKLPIAAKIEKVSDFLKETRESKRDKRLGLETTEFRSPNTQNISTHIDLAERALLIIENAQFIIINLMIQFKTDKGIETLTFGSGEHAIDEGLNITIIYMDLFKQMSSLLKLIRTSKETKLLKTQSIIIIRSSK